MLKRILIAAILIGTPPIAAACQDPATYGAVPGDGVDDGPAIRASLLVGDACLDAGVWDIGYVYGSGSIIVPSGRTLSGAGPSTVLRMSGDAHLGTWFGVRVQGGTLRDLAMTQAIVNPDPGGQNHLIRVDDSNGSRLSRLALGPMSTGGGDCIQLLGNTSDITALTISDVVALGCERSGIAIQHGVASASISGFVLSARIGSEIDYEPTSPGPTTITWSSGVLLHSSVARALTMSDSGGDNRSTFTGLLILGGNVQAVRAAGVSFTGNVVIGSTTAPTSTFEVIRDSANTRVVGNYFVRPASAPVGVVVRFVCNQGVCPTRVVIADNVIEQGGLQYAIEGDGLTVSAIHDNAITTAWSYAIRLGASARSPDVVSISDNVVESTAVLVPGASAIYLAASPTWTMGRVLIAGNIGRGFANSVLCANVMVGPIRVDDNILGAVACGAPVSIGTNL